MRKTLRKIKNSIVNPCTGSLLFSFFTLLACSNSIAPETTTDNSSSFNDSDTSITQNKKPFYNSTSSSSIITSYNSNLTNSNSSLASNDSIIPTEYLPLNDTEYPYAGIPRIVIETKDLIKDKETEIPAKLQIYGEKAPESEIMDLTIRGRGNTTWTYPKKPYQIEFTQKRSFLGMPKAKKWIMLANYRDRSLIRNALALEIARRSNIGWTPQGKFVDVFLNKKFIGNYFICEKIEVKKNRLEVDDDAYLLEFDDHYDEEYKFYTLYRKFPTNIKYPKSLTDSQFQYIKEYINAIEEDLYTSNNNGYKDSLDYLSFARYYIINELVQDADITNPQSLFVYKDYSILKAGPVWDFDWCTFNPNREGLIDKKSLWFDKMLNDKSFRKLIVSEWDANKKAFESMTDYLDSLQEYIKESSITNYKIWPVKISSGIIGDEKLNYEDAKAFIKQAYIKRYNELNQIFKSSFIQ